MKNERMPSRTQIKIAVHRFVIRQNKPAILSHVQESITQVYANFENADEAVPPKAAGSSASLAAKTDEFTQSEENETSDAFTSLANGV